MRRLLLNVKGGDFCGSQWLRLIVPNAGQLGLILFENWNPCCSKDLTSSSFKKLAWPNREEQISLFKNRSHALPSRQRELTNL